MQFNKVTVFGIALVAFPAAFLLSNIFSTSEADKLTQGVIESEDKLQEVQALFPGCEGTSAATIAAHVFLQDYVTAAAQMEQHCEKSSVNNARLAEFYFMGDVFPEALSSARAALKQPESLEPGFRAQTAAINSLLVAQEYSENQQANLRAEGITTGSLALELEPERDTIRIIVATFLFYDGQHDAALKLLENDSSAEEPARLADAKEVISRAINTGDTQGLPF